MRHKNNFKIFSVVVSAMLILLSCQRNNEGVSAEDLNTSSIQQKNNSSNLKSTSFNSYDIFYDNNGTNTQITESEYHNFLISVMNVPSNSNFDHTEVLSNGSDKYLLTVAVSSSGTTYRISDQLSGLGGDEYLLAGSTCACTTSDCVNLGCEVLNKGVPCECSECPGEGEQCTKTHTVTSEYSSAWFQ